MRQKQGKGQRKLPAVWLCGRACAEAQGLMGTRWLSAVPLLLFVPLRLQTLLRKAAAASDNAFSLSDAEGGCQPRRDKAAKDIYNCVIKRLLCLPDISCCWADGSIVRGNGNCKGS